MQAHITPAGRARDPYNNSDGYWHCSASATAHQELNLEAQMNNRNASGKLVHRIKIKPLRNKYLGFRIMPEFADV